MKTNYEKLSDLLKKLFQLDQADLDFGIYRIMNQKRGEITRFLEKDLLPQVQEAFGIYKSADKAELEEELEKTIQSAKAAGFDPEESPRLKEIREGLGRYGVDTTALENEVFSDLYDFFRRYYHEGDFLSLRRYKEGIYAIPYEGEEVKLHWANHDQYYIKTSEYFRDYTFKLSSGNRVHFKLVEADTEKDNIKAQSGNERRFILCEEETLEEIDGELYIRFQYAPDPEKRKQTAINEYSVERLLGLVLKNWSELGVLQPTEKNPQRTLLEKHLTDYTARNTFDYFIHKDLDGFLKRELDFYIKNEIMHLDDIENETATRLEQYLSKIKVIRKIAHKIIDFLAQIENFQKKMWLKKKFVVETNYCVTLDRVPEELYPEIIANDAQREEWVKLFAIDEIEDDSPGSGAYSEPLTFQFLKSNQTLVLDTKYFNREFRNRLISKLDSVDQENDGFLISSDNFHALTLLLKRYQGKVNCIYIDPPYNTGNDEFIYRDNYRHSCWLSMLRTRILIAKNFLHPSGTIGISIDNNEIEHLLKLMDSIFGAENRRNIITIKRGSVTGPKVINPGVVNVAEYLVVYSNSKSDWNPNRVYRMKQRDKRYSKFILNNHEDPSMWKFSLLSQAFADYKGIPLREVKNTLKDNFQDELDRFVIDNAHAVIRTAALDVSKISQEALELKKTSENNPNKIYHLKRDKHEDWYVINGERILFYSDRLTKIGENFVPGELITDIWDDVLPNDLHNEGGVTLKKGKKPEKLVSRLIELSTQKNDIVLDFFAGSGTACAAAHKMHRKWIGVEMAEFFDTLMKTRMKNTLHGERSGISSTFKWTGGGFFTWFQIESYEDTLNNLELKRTEAQQSLLEQSDSFRESYMLSYMLDVESKGSESLLNLNTFEDPFNYKLNISTGSAGETKPITIDLVETFNYLIGLTVNHIDNIRGFRVIQGTSPKGEKVLVIWRNLKEKSNKDLDEFFRKQEYNPKDMEFDLIYVNGDNNLENLRREDETWKVRLIEEDFMRLMFDVQDV